MVLRIRGINALQLSMYPVKAVSKLFEGPDQSALQLSDQVEIVVAACLGLVDPVIDISQLGHSLKAFTRINFVLAAWSWRCQWRH